MAGQDHPLASGLGDLEVLPFARLGRVALVAAALAADVAVGQVAGDRRRRGAWAFSELCSDSTLIATCLCGSTVRSVMVWLSMSASTLTSTIARPWPTRASSMRWMLARIVSARAFGLPGPLSASSLPARTTPFAASITATASGATPATAEETR
jgi:hypothetical protein